MRRQGWPAEWIREAKRLARDMWQEFYLLPARERTPSVNHMVSCMAVHKFIRRSHVQTFNRQILDELDNILAASSQKEKEENDEFEVFVEGPKTDIMVAPFNGQALVWWAHQPSMNGLRRMAFDLLGIPGKPFKRSNGVHH
jgi:hypothetical protein